MVSKRLQSYHGKSASQIQIRTSLPAFIEQEIAEPTVWTLQFFIPFSLFEPFAGKLGSCQARCGVEIFSSAPKKSRIRIGRVVTGG